MLNRATLIGRLGRDPEVRYTPDGTAAVTLSLATTEKWKDKSGTPQEHTEWHRCIAWGKLGEICGQYLKKGGLVYVEGRLETQQWTDKNGVERYTTQVRMDQMRMLSGRPDGSTEKSAPAQAPSKPPSKFDELEDDIPF